MEAAVLFKADGFYQVLDTVRVLASLSPLLPHPLIPALLVLLRMRWLRVGDTGLCDHREATSSRYLTLCEDALLGHKLQRVVAKAWKVHALLLLH